jgi:hypothetical protein
MSYFDRAVKSRDPRFRRVLEKLGYGTRAMQAESMVEAVAEPETSEDIADIRAEYERLIGRRPFMGWDIETLRAKIDEANS